jgi:2-dehydro-3-deoxyphosphogalactonate aldolase
MLESYLQELPLIAILRGVTSGEVEAIGQALFAAGFRIIEVPLNSPEPLASIRRLTASLGDRCLIGSGTVTQVSQVADVAAAGAKLVVSPHADTAVVRASVEAGLVSTPGAATPTEAFAALAAGAHGLKLFPAEAIEPKIVKAWRSVMPADTLLLPVGGITPEKMSAYVEAGANGFGLGSALYKAGMDVGTVAANAKAFARAWRELAVA